MAINQRKRKAPLKGIAAQRCNNYPNQRQNTGAQQTQAATQLRWAPTNSARELKKWKAKAERAEKQEKVWRDKHAALDRELDEMDNLVAQLREKIFAEDMAWRKKCRTARAQLSRLKKKHPIHDPEILSVDIMEEEPESSDEVEGDVGWIELQRVTGLIDAMQSMMYVEDEDDDDPKQEAAAVSDDENLQVTDCGDAEVEAPRRDSELEDVHYELLAVAGSDSPEISLPPIPPESPSHELASQQRMQKRRTRKTPAVTTRAEPGSRPYKKWRKQQVQRIVGFFTSMFGAAWREEYSVQQDYDDGIILDLDRSSTSTDLVLDILDAFFKQYQIMFEELAKPGRCGAHAAFIAESAAVARQQEHMDRVALGVFTGCNLTQKGWQELIDLSSFEAVEDGSLVRLKLPAGTYAARWMSRDKVVELAKQNMHKLGLDLKQPNAAWVDPELVIVKRVRELEAKGLLQVADGMTLKVQLLGDATTVWKSLRVNGTTIVLKVLYDDKNVSCNMPLPALLHALPTRTLAKH